MQKPLFRWVVGPMSKIGLVLFRKAVRNIKKIYKKDFDFLICHNNINPNKFCGLGVPLLDQNKLYNKFDKEYDSIWKLMPVRLSKQTHEIVIDSDIYLFEKIPQIDNFLKSDHILICEGIGRNYGIYEKKIPIGLQINSGVYGLPPNFDFEVKQKKMKWFDEQGLLCHELILYKKYDLIPQSVVPIVTNEQLIDYFFKCKSTCGFHFVRTNGKKAVNKATMAFLNYKIF